MLEERKQKRTYVMSYLKICQKDTARSLGRVVDITTEGMRLCGEEPIQTDRTIKFSLALPIAAKGNSEVVFDADIIWCRRAKNPDLYDTGIRLKNVPADQIDIIEDFMENSSFEDRWLSIVNTLNEEY